MTIDCAPKIINDPVHGFLSVSDPLLLWLIEQPSFQRLRRIRQLGMGSLVYPGAQHTRLQHSLGATYLMGLALDTLQAKGVEISAKERRAALCAILLHDVGHGPYSHALEGLLCPSSHEDITRLVMCHLNRQCSGALDDAIMVYNGQCRPFLHQLIASQLDTDRLDYLKRDSFFSGVVEGTIGAERIVKMLTVTRDEQLAVEQKGIYTIEAFLVSRRLMYWQVYLHKTVLASEKMLRAAVSRARELAAEGRLPRSTDALDRLLRYNADEEESSSGEQLLSDFLEVDDSDVGVALKAWQRSEDAVLRLLSEGLVRRRIFRIELQTEPFAPDVVERHVAEVALRLDLERDQASRLVITGHVASTAYSVGGDQINIARRDGSVCDISEASDMMRLGTLERPDQRYFLCRPRLDDTADNLFATAVSR